MLFYLIFIVILKVTFCYPHFIDEEIDSQGGEKNSPKSHKHKLENDRYENQTMMCLTFDNHI